MMDKKKDKTFQLAFSGICLGISVILIFAGGILPGIEMTCFALAGLVLGFAIYENGIKGGAMVYIGTVLLSFVLVPNKMAIVPYALFFGIYPFVKYVAEKIERPAGQIAAKAVFSMAILGGAYFLMEDLFFGNGNLPDIASGLLIPAFGLVALLYDYIFTLALNIYRQRVKRDKIDFRLSGEEDGNEKR